VVLRGRDQLADCRAAALTKATVGKWRQRFLQYRLAGLYDELRPGRPRTIEDEQVAALLKRTMSRKPTFGTHWTVRAAARASGLSKSTVHRLFQAFALQPHRTRRFKLSTDPFFVEKVRDIGTTTLFAALDIATGAVFTECKPHHRLARGAA